MRIFHAAGPGNVAGTFRCWKKGEDDPAQVAVTYSAQFFDVCEELDAVAHVIASFREPAFERDDRFVVEHRPMPLMDRGGVLYHLGQILYALMLVVSALRFRAEVAVIGGVNHWFALAPLRLAGIHVVPTLHGVFWEQYGALGRGTRLLRRLNGPFFRHCCAAVMSLSSDISKQVEEMTGKSRPPIVPFLPWYQRESFSDVSPPERDKRPFRVLYVGRIEATKGVFDCLEIAKRFRALGRDDIVFDLCGDGGAMAELRAEVERAGLGERFCCHGHCTRDVMRQMYESSYLVIAPTRAELIEGFNKVLVEAVLAGRPVVSSAVCPGIRYVREAAIQVEPDDVQGYADAILRLVDDPEFYEDKRRACVPIQEQFYDPSRGWGAALRRVLSPLMSAPRA